MDKKSNPKAQIYRHSPKKSIIREKLNDGYEIEDMCLYIYGEIVGIYCLFFPPKKEMASTYKVCSFYKQNCVNSYKQLCFVVIIDAIYCD